MAERVLSAPGARRRRGEGGFTLVEVMTATMIGVVALTANLTMFNFAQRDFAYSRGLTEATNEATRVIADFKTRTIAEINNTTDLVANGLVVGTHRETPALGNCAQIGGRAYCRSWVVSNVDVEPDGTADMVGDIVKVKLTVDWWIGEKRHTVTMSTLTTGKPL